MGPKSLPDIINEIYDGVNPILDGLRNQLDDHDSWLKSQEIEEKKNSKIHKAANATIKMMVANSNCD